MSKARLNSAALLLHLLVLMYGVAYAAESAGAVIDKTSPPTFQRLFSVHLQLKTVPPDYVAEKRPPALSNSNAAIKFAKLANETWFNEEVTCVRQSPDGRMVAVGGYIRKTSLLGKMPRRVYGSKIHLLDTVARKEVITFETAPVAERTREEKGGSKILDSMFLSNSRFLVAVTNSKLFLWDTQHGTVLSELFFDRAISKAALEYGKSAGQDYLAVISEKHKWVFQIVGL